MATCLGSGALTLVACGGRCERARAHGGSVRPAWSQERGPRPLGLGSRRPRLRLRWRHRAGCSSWGLPGRGLKSHTRRSGAVVDYDLAVGGGERDLLAPLEVVRARELERMGPGSVGRAKTQSSAGWMAMCWEGISVCWQPQLGTPRRKLLGFSGSVSQHWCGRRAANVGLAAAGYEVWWGLHEGSTTRNAGPR